MVGLPALDHCVFYGPQLTCWRKRDHWVLDTDGIYTVNSEFFFRKK